MRKEIVVRMQLDSDKCQRKALKVAASVRGVQSVSVTGREMDLLLVIGDVDEVELIKKLKDKVGNTETVELRTLPAAGDVLATQSPYQHWRHYSTRGRSVPGAGRIIEYSTPSPLQHYPYPSPFAGPGRAGYGYGEDSCYGYGLTAVAHSHPARANYSPMIARHDYRTVGRTPRQHDSGGGPTCCTIL